MMEWDSKETIFPQLIKIRVVWADCFMYDHQLFSIKFYIENELIRTNSGERKWYNLTIKIFGLWKLH